MFTTWTQQLPLGAQQQTQKRAQIIHDLLYMDRLCVCVYVYMWIMQSLFLSIKICHSLLWSSLLHAVLIKITMVSNHFISFLLAFVYMLGQSVWAKIKDKYAVKVLVSWINLLLCHMMSSKSTSELCPRRLPALGGVSLVTMDIALGVEVGG